MKVSVLSQAEASLYEPREGSKAAIIRIADKIDILPELIFPYDIVGTIGFYDIRRLMPTPSNWNAFSHSDARTIHKWFHLIKSGNIDELVIHCMQGVSRSPAIGIAFGWFMEDESIVESVMSKPVAPNIFILDKMSAELGVRSEKRRWIRELEDSMQDVSGEVEF